MACGCTVFYILFERAKFAVIKSLNLGREKLYSRTFPSMLSERSLVHSPCLNIQGVGRMAAQCWCTFCILFLYCWFLFKNPKIVSDNHVLESRLVDSRRNLNVKGPGERVKLGHELVLESFHTQLLVLPSEQNGNLTCFQHEELREHSVSPVSTVDKGQNDWSTEPLVHSSPHWLQSPCPKP